MTGQLDHFRRIYSTEAAAYDAMVSREDYEGNLLPALTNACDMFGKIVVELGAGTGRLTRLLAPLAGFVYAFDASREMLAVARDRMASTDFDNIQFYPGDNRCLPNQNAIADITIAGWSIGHSVGWYPSTWEKEIGLAIDEMVRVTRSGGTLIIVETMGTGVYEPAPPSADLDAYYTWLTEARGFVTAPTIRTDYRFSSVDEAVSHMRFFFGDAVAERIVAESWEVVPEFTGIWWKRNG